MDMHDYRKAGGIAALIHSAAYLIGIGLYLSVLSPILDAEPTQYLALLGKYQGVMYAWIFIVYWLAALCLIVLALAFYERLKSRLHIGLQTATVLGLVWAGLVIASGNLMLHDFGQMAKLHAGNAGQAETVWLALMNVENGLVSGNELIGGLWVLAVSWFALQARWLPRLLHYLGLLVGLVGILSIIPSLSDVVMLFGPAMIVWSAWVGIAMLRSRSRDPLRFEGSQPG
ncbi:MAG: DUF4386 family protein [Rhodanobacteraceae bacterium]